MRSTGCGLPFRPRITGGMKASPAMVEVRPGWQALGYSTTSVERASGQHAKDLLVVVEEVSGVEGEIWDAIESPQVQQARCHRQPDQGGRPIQRVDSAS